MSDTDRIRHNLLRLAGVVRGYVERNDVPPRDATMTLVEAVEAICNAARDPETPYQTAVRALRGAAEAMSVASPGYFVAEIEATLHPAAFMGVIHSMPEAVYRRADSEHALFHGRRIELDFDSSGPTRMFVARDPRR